MDVGALSLGEWNYLRGLFLADGCMDVKGVERRKPVYRVRFFLQGNEGELGCRVMGLLRRAGLSPAIETRPPKKMLVVRVHSLALLNFLPDKKKLLGGGELVREAFFEDCSLRGVEGGVPFFAGLLDGDGWCVARRLFEGKRWLQFSWSFSQKKMRFLVEYARRLVESLSPSGTTATVYHGAATLLIRKSGRAALLAAGIADYSWKVTRWLRRVAELTAEFKSAPWLRHPD